MNHDIYHRTLALSALLQFICNVNKLANQGVIEPAMLNLAINSIIRLESNTLEEIYGGLANLKEGFRCLQEQLGSHGVNEDRKEMLNYTNNIFHLERKLVNNPKISTRLESGLRTIARQYNYFQSPHENIIHSVDILYQETISQLGSRIMVQGDPNLLIIDRIAAQIRLLLLAAVRATVLWRQAGGNRIRLLIERNKILQQAFLLSKSHNQ